MDSAEQLANNGASESNRFSVPLAYQTKRHVGLPELGDRANDVSWFEFLPGWVFYAPLVMHMCWLAIRYGGLLSPSASNPLFPNGGLWGESKRAILDQFGPAAEVVTADYIVDVGDDAASGERLSRSLVAMQEQGVAFPVVAKPDIGKRGAGVKVAENEAALAAYLENFPADADVMIQSLVEWEGEAGVFFIREPGQSRGQIFSLTLKYLPYVEGDGVKTLRQLIENDPRASQVKELYFERHSDQLDTVVPAGVATRLAFSGSHCRGAVFKDGGQLVTDAMVDTFNKIADDIPEFYFGRFDVRFADVESLQRGEDFRIIELNGGGSEATHVWDGRNTLLAAYKTLSTQYRLLWKIGNMNRKRGFKPTPAMEQIRMHLREQALTRHYPKTDEGRHYRALCSLLMV